MTLNSKQKNLRLPKKRIQKILVPLDGSKFSNHALDYAINLAKYTGSKIIGLFVISSDVSTMPLEEIFDPLSKIKPIGYETKMTKQAEKILCRAENICTQNKIEFITKILVGNPGHDIVKYAEDKKITLD